MKTKTLKIALLSVLALTVSAQAQAPSPKFIKTCDSHIITLEKQVSADLKAGKAITTLADTKFTKNGYLVKGVGECTPEIKAFLAENAERGYFNVVNGMGEVLLYFK